jgi:para-nitrobenzyl esterase
MIVATSSGKVRGISKQGVLQFRGIPYATAERFEPPRPVQPWDGVRDATAFASMAPQNPSPLEQLLGAQAHPYGEDCLALNVFTSGIDDAPRPVMVWIHGGAFVAGSAHVPWYNATNLVRLSDVVVVTINYRLGALGFLHLGHLAPELATSGTNGIADQIAALRWVRDNIAAFGGDPDNVTIFGESAGGMSVGTLLGTPDARGLFHGAIAQSGAADHVHPPERAEWITDRFLRAVGLSPTSVDGLRALPVDRVLAAQAAVATDVQNGDAADVGVGPGSGVLAFQPVVDGTLLPQPPLEAVRHGNAAGVPLVIGTTADEWNLFHIQFLQSGPLTEDTLRRRLRRIVGSDHAHDALDAYRTAGRADDPDAVLCAAMTDKVFRMPAIRLAEAQLPHAPRVSMYRFGYPSTAFGGVLGACHAIDVPFVFANLDTRGVELLVGDIDDDARRLSDRCARAWTSAAVRGSPEHDDLAWPAYDVDRRATCELDRTPLVSDDPDARLRALWSELVPASV